MKIYKYSVLPSVIRIEVDRRRECSYDYSKCYAFDPCPDMFYFDLKSKSVELIDSMQETLESYDQKSIDDGREIMLWFIENKWNKKTDVIILMEK